MTDKYVVMSAGNQGVRVGFADLGDLQGLHALMVSVANIKDLATPTEWTVSEQSDTDTALTVSKATPGEARAHVITGFEAVVLGAATGSAVTITLKGGTTVLWQTAMGVGVPIGTRIAFSGLHLGCTEDAAVSLEADAGGEDCVVALNLMGYTREV